METLLNLKNSFSIISRTGIVKKCDPKLGETLFNLQAVDLTGSNICKFLSSENCKLFTHHLSLCIDTGEEFLSELTINGSDRRYYLELLFFPLSNSEALVVFRNLIHPDQTSILDVFTKVFAKSHELIMILDAKRIIQYVNKKFIETTGYKPSEVTNQPLFFLNANKHLAGFYDSMWENLNNGNETRAHFFIKKKHGESFIADKTIFPIANARGEITYFISQGIDVTGQQRNQRKLETNRRFEKMIEKREQRSRSISLLKGQEDERRRIAKEIHDGVGQMLTVSKANLESIDTARLKNRDTAERIHLVTEILPEIIQELRRISQNLSPVGLSEFGLHDTVVQLSKRFNSHSKKLKITLESNIEGLRLKEDVEINLYRIIQEALQNAHKHSHASRIDLKLDMKDNVMSVVVCDNGVGFDLKQLKRTNKHIFGIINIEERVKLLKGVLDFVSQKNKGVNIRVVIKIKKNQYAKNISC